MLLKLRKEVLMYLLKIILEIVFRIVIEKPRKR